MSNINQNDNFMNQLQEKIIGLIKVRDNLANELHEEKCNGKTQFDFLRLKNEELKQALNNLANELHNERYSKNSQFDVLHKENEKLKESLKLKDNENKNLISKNESLSKENEFLRETNKHLDKQLLAYSSLVNTSKHISQPISSTFTHSIHESIPQFSSINPNNNTQNKLNDCEIITTVLPKNKINLLDTLEIISNFNKKKINKIEI